MCLSSFAGDAVRVMRCAEDEPDGGYVRLRVLAEPLPELADLRSLTITTSSNQSDFRERVELSINGEAGNLTLKNAARGPEVLFAFC